MRSVRAKRLRFFALHQHRFQIRGFIQLLPHLVSLGLFNQPRRNDICQIWQADKGQLAPDGDQLGKDKDKLVGNDLWMSQVLMPIPI